MLKLYLAHPLEARELCREAESRIECESSVDILNPFYDTQRKEIYKMDKGGLDRRSDDFLLKLNFEKIVTTDLMHLESCDGVLAYVDLEYYTIGTICELWHGLKHGKIIYIITPNCASHPWLRFMVIRSGGGFFKDFDEFCQWCKENHKK